MKKIIPKNELGLEGLKRIFAESISRKWIIGDRFRIDKRDKKAAEANGFITKDFEHDTRFAKDQILIITDPEAYENGGPSLAYDISRRTIKYRDLIIDYINKDLLDQYLVTKAAGGFVTTIDLTHAVLSKIYYDFEEKDPVLQLDIPERLNAYARSKTIVNTIAEDDFDWVVKGLAKNNYKSKLVMEEVANGNYHLTVEVLVD